MGMADAMTRRWTEANELYLGAQRKAADATGGFGNLSKVLRFLLQSAVLGVGAWLVIEDKATAGVMIAASILSARALAPIELAIAHGAASSPPVRAGRGSARCSRRCRPSRSR
jgi:ATP-binding cassette subfamily C protein